MSQVLICLHGHQWEAADDGPADETLPARVCPRCGAACARVAMMESAFDWQTVEQKPTPPTVETIPVTAPSRPAAEDFPTVAGYEILRKLGQGGMGVVYQARQVSLNRLVALKMIRAGADADAEDLARFRTEAEAVAHLQHPNIVQIYEVGEQAGRPYFSLEFVDGGSLDAKLAGTPLAAQPAAQLVETLARAIQYAHERGVIHRDLKPANILLQSGTTNHTNHTNQNQTERTSGLTGPSAAPSSFDSCDSWLNFLPKITDFGLAKRVDVESGQTRTGAIVGTPSYMAPEQAQARGKEVGPLADVYSLGGILYDLLTGRPPFKAQTALDTVLLVISQDPVPPSRFQPGVPRDLETVCLKCLEKDARKRYASAGALADDLRRFLDGRPIQARPASPWERAAKWARRRPAQAALAVLLALLAVGLPVGGLWYAGHERQRAAEADAQRDRAQKAEREARRLLTQSFAATARLAMQRGDWPAALRYLDKALEAGHPGAVDLRLAKVRAWCAVNEVPPAARELEALARRPDLTRRQRGLVLLWQGDLAVSRSHRHAEEALALVRRAVASDLPGPEEAYARGLLAQTTPEAVRYFRRALELDPYHPRANSTLALTLISQGRLAEARDRLLFAEPIFPQDPTLKVLHAVVRALEGDRAGAGRALDRADKLLPDPRQRATARTMIDLLAELHDAEGLFSGDPKVSLFGAVRKFAPAALRLSLTMQPDRRKGAAPATGPLLLPFPPIVAKNFRELGGAMPAILLGNHRRACRVLGTVVESHPEGLFCLLHGMTLAAQNRWPEAEAAFLKAAELPALVPVHRPALVNAVLAEWILAGRKQGAEREALKRRALENTRRAVRAGPLRPHQASYLSIVALEMNDLDVARWIIAGWEREAPGDLELLRRRLAVEFKGGAYERVLQVAGKILARRAHDKEALQYQAAARARLRPADK